MPDAKQQSQSQASQKSISDKPSLSLPKGGGAIRGIGEKFAANPVTGTGSISVPIAVSPGRAGFGPDLSLSYDSGSGNGPFGFGWSLSTPAITRKTDKGLPRYNDAHDSDVFLLSGAEDLVPEFKKDANGNWILDNGRHVLREKPRSIDGVTYTVRCYRPRVEGLFARIERWTQAEGENAGDVHWCSISRENILTIYGKDGNSRIHDPEDANRIFSWLISETRDDKGNAVIYEYKPEDGVGVDPARASERNRGERNDPRRAANRYLKRIHYGNRTPLLDDQGKRPQLLCADQIDAAGWMFEVVFDYDDHDETTPKPMNAGEWAYRTDPFSTYRPGFEVRTTRLCQRVLMFHHFEDEQDVGEDCLVRSTDFTYSHEQDPGHARNPIYTFLREVTQCGYRRDGDGYLKRSLPPVAFEYTQPVVQDTVESVTSVNLENLPIGVDGATYQWTDLHGEGIPGILTEQAGAWFYKRNISPGSESQVEFAPLETVVAKPNQEMAAGAQFMDLAGDGQPDLVMLDGTSPGLYEHDTEEGWHPFRPFTSRLNRNMQDPNLKLVDLNGDGHADVLITEDHAMVWHASLAEAGFGAERRVPQALDEEKGPRLVFADESQSIQLADLSGDGLTDLVRLRNGEVCYWPNLGYGRFGAKVTMDRSPWFDHPDQFDQKRIRLADIDGTGTIDIIYLHRDGVRLYFNQSGNGWSEPAHLNIAPRVEDLVSIAPADLLGNGTSCLVWSSSLPGDESRRMRYVNLMGGQKPHLLVKTDNNLGAETRVHYAPSTKFYLQDKQAGKPWITRLPFPIHVVERVETYDHISRNRFVTRYAYHHGYFDGEEREFRGFGMVEQWDTEAFAALSQDDAFLLDENIDISSHVPPVLTRTWFHTGAYLDRERISHQYEREYYREPGLNDMEAQAMLLEDTLLPEGLTAEEEREACRALKGTMLRQEVYALDGREKKSNPYTVAEQSFTIRRLQPEGGNRHGVFFTHARESITYHYERNPTDPRTAHAMTLEVDSFGNVLKQVAIGYGRREPDESLPLQEDREKQTQTLITYTENRVTKAIDRTTGFSLDYRTPLPCETQTYELTGYTPTGEAGRFQFTDFVQPDPEDPNGHRQIHLYDSETAYHEEPSTGRQRRIVEHLRIHYRPDDLGQPQNDSFALLPLGELEPLALPGETYKLAFTSEFLTHVYRRPRDGEPHEDLLTPDHADILACDTANGQTADRGGYVNLDGEHRWWVPSGRVFYSEESHHSPSRELSQARQHFFASRRFVDPFGAETTVSYDEYDLLTVGTVDALQNTVTAHNDYRVLQPFLVVDPNGNRSQAAFDALGMVAGTAVMGKDGEGVGDHMAVFDPDPLRDPLDADTFFGTAGAPLGLAQDLLGSATTRILYDPGRFQRSRQDHPDDPDLWQPTVAATLARETHINEPLPPGGLKIQISFSYSDGFGRQIQQKIQAEPGPLDLGDPGSAHADPRWVGSGWTIFNNKGKPVRQYEPFFDDTHAFKFGKQSGASPILFYDPLQRMVATLHPNHTWEKVCFNPWQQETWDVNDTVLVEDPAEDPDVGDYFSRLDVIDYLPTWYERMSSGTAEEQDAATKAAAHADTFTATYFDTLGRPFLTVAKNKVVCENHDYHGTENNHRTRVDLDIEGNQCNVKDERSLDDGRLEQRVAMQYLYSIAGPEEDENGEPTNTHLVHQISMEAGERWILNDVTGQPIRTWDSKGQTFRTEYDALRRPLRIFATIPKPDQPLTEILTERLMYGESHPNAQALNLRGQPYLQLDQAGAVTTEAFDFKGNPLTTARRLAVDFEKEVDWNSVDSDDADEVLSAIPALLEEETFTAETTYDALNRPTTLKTPHSDAMSANVIRPVYNEANLLDSMEANLRGETDKDGQPVWTPFILNVDYDAKGQRQQITYGNNVVTTYEYDPETFRLIHLQTIRGGGALQDLFYTYDPVGNITHIRDNAQQTLFFDNTEVLPHADYVYDAVYRVIQATGREHLGQVAPHSAYDNSRTGLPHPNSGMELTGYTERYLYDDVGNILQMQHRFNNQNNGGWTRHYTYNEESLIDRTQHSNRLSKTSGIEGQNPENYSYDAHGNITHMNHLSTMAWDYRDQLHKTARQADNADESPETTYYVYDAGGQRLRKVSTYPFGQNEKPQKKNERIYLGGFEIYRKYQPNDASPTLERETLHIMDNQQCIAMVETRTQGNEPGMPVQLIRYQLSNHLGSSSLEIDGSEFAQIISFEEYFPYGGTSYQGICRDIEVPIKRFRYIGKERDEESGFNYHGARYYAVWLGRWVSSDPIGLVDGVNLYTYTTNNPIRFIDTEGKQKAQKDQYIEFNELNNHDLCKAILMFSRSKISKTEMGQKVRNKLIELLKKNEIGLEVLEMGLGGQFREGSSGDDKYDVALNKRQSFVSMSVTLVHEVVHAVLEGEDIHPIDNELAAFMLETQYYKELKEGNLGINVDPKREIVLEDWLKLVQDDRMIDYIIGSKKYSKYLDVDWVVENVNRWGGIANREAETKAKYIITLAQEGKEHLDLIDRLYIRKKKVLFDIETGPKYHAVIKKLKEKYGFNPSPNIYNPCEGGYGQCIKP